MWSLGISILNGNTALENVNDQAYLKYAIYNFKKSTRSKLLEKLNS